MRPMAARSSRSSLHHPRSSPILIPSIASSVHQQQQPILYAPISNPIVNLQPCGTGLHPTCVYPNAQPHIGSSNSAPLHLQGKNNRWHSKNKLSRGQQHYQQQQQFYNQKPMVLFDQPANSIASLPPPTTSFLVASSTFTHGPLPSEHYSNTSGMTHLLPQSYLKPPDVHQTFCLIQDRQNAQQQHQHQQQQHPMQASYYNISATNTCSLQTVNANSSFPLANLNPYSSLATFTNSQFPASVQSSPLFSNTPVGLVFASSSRDKSLPLPTLEFSSFKHNTSKISSICESRVVPMSHDNSNGWPSQIEKSSKNSYYVQTTGNNKSLESADCSLQKVVSTIAKTDEEHYSDESSTSFDFTIEAEKMVSALCNTTSSNDLGKEESKLDKIDSTPLFSGAGDNVTNKAPWFTDFCPEYENGTSIGVQTDSLGVDRSQYPELIRKTAYWGCTEAEIVLASESSQTDFKRNWLTCLSSATRTAITKSSTCIPVFAGDRVFADDLINALLRISNGWLSLDNYLNKQHFPNLLDRLDPEFIACFHTWEESTHELLKQTARTFRKFGENNEVTNVEQKRKETCAGSSSFPGDVSLYTNCDLFVPLSLDSVPQRNANEKTSTQENSHSAASVPLSASLRNFQYIPGLQEQQSAKHKESKLRSKWTITENLSSLVNSAKSSTNASVCHADVSGLAGKKLRIKDTSSSRKSDSTQKSLNAEFCQLRNKVMESNADAMKDKRQNCVPENKLSSFADNTESIRLQNPAINTPVSYRGLYAQNCMSFTFPLSNQSDPSINSSYPTTNAGIVMYGGSSYPTSASYPITDSNSRGSKNSEQIYEIKSASVNPVYVNRSQADQIELPSVPRNKVTLLSQIEPRTFDKESEEMAANLSAWFASMRNARLPTSVATYEEARLNENSSTRLFVHQEMPNYSIGLHKQSQINANRQFQALQNMPNIQSTPWAAGNFVNSRSQVQHSPEEYDSSEDVRVYMKPGSYNVPKKRHQRRSNRRSDNNATSRNLHTSNHHNMSSNKTKNVSIPASSTPLSTNVSNATLIKTSFPPASQLPVPLFNLENSLGIPERTKSLSKDAHRDVTWKAACASAEILLEALNVKDCGNVSKKVDCNGNTEEDENAETLATTSQQYDIKSVKCEVNEVDCASSYEVSDDDSGSARRQSPSTSVILVSRDNDNALMMKTNVKTDSWLIRTLNNASIVSKQRRRSKDDRRSFESSSSSVIIDAKSDRLASTSTVDTKAPTLIIANECPAFFSREDIPSFFSKSDETSMKELETHAGRATYSETVRRSIKSDSVRLGRKESYKSRAISSSMICGNAIPSPGRKYQRKDPEQSYQLLHKSRRSIGKKAMRNADNKELKLQEGLWAKISNVKSSNVTPKLSTKTNGKKKDSEYLEGKYAGKTNDRGWSVWYSSKRKQSLSPLTFNKLETIHQTIWQMDEAKIFKYPSACGDKNGQSPLAEMIKDYCKVVKSPMFLEIVEYKLKNRVYHKVEHAVKDFRRVIHDARLCHQHNGERVKKIETLSKKLEDLLEEHFGNCDFNNTTDSPSEDSPVQLRLKTSEQKSIVGRYNSTKKAASSLTIAENSSLQ